MAFGGGGKESEWNEASFKSKRLHEIQELINFLKLNPLGITDGKFNYEWLLNNIDALYGEGRSKYNKTEKKEVDELRKVCRDCIKFMPPHIKTIHNNFGGKRESYLFHQKNFEILMDLLYKFEMKVKDLNDDHGLTTKNKVSSMF